MKKQKKYHVLINHLNEKMAQCSLMPEVPVRGWINSIRTTLKMSSRQLGIRLGISAQHARRLEIAEQDGNITLATLNSFASTMNMRFVYGFTTKDGSLTDIVDRRIDIVVSKLSKSENASERRSPEELSEETTQKLAEKLREELPRNLWTLK